MYDETTKLRTCDICKQPMEHDIYHTNGGKDGQQYEICETCEYKIREYDTRLQMRYERLVSAAERTEQQARATYAHARKMAEVIPFGQPILVGHHSERADRNYRDRIHNTYGRAFEAFAKAEDLKRKAAHPSKAISSDNPEAVLLLQSKLEALEADQVHMVKVNSIIKKLVKKPRKSKAQREQDDRTLFRGGNTLTEINATHKARHDAERAIADGYMAYADALAEQAGIGLLEAQGLLKPDFMNRIGYPSYMLTNNNANIRRIKERIEELTKKAVIVATAEQAITVTEFGVVKIEEDTESNRIRVYFPGKPSAKIISQLKSNGWHWSPYFKAWLRQITEAARYSAKSIAILVEQDSHV